LKGLLADNQVVLIDFWTYTCINCLRTLPALRSWDERYGDNGLTIVGVHSPEFPIERDADNVQTSIEDNNLHYPVAQDNNLSTWTAYGNQYWPAKYLIDAEGNVRYVHFGEGGYDETELAIRTLIAEANDGKVVPEAKTVSIERGDPRLGTPETYLGAERAQGFANGPLSVGRRDFGTLPDSDLEKLGQNAFLYQGKWDIGTDFAAAASDSSQLSATFTAKRVFLVLESKGRPRKLRVGLDGRPIADAVAGEDVKNGVVTVNEPRLYRLIDLPEVRSHRLDLSFEKGLRGFAFTFG
jgi:thiol-disulfide isomerase/thioredoxin